MAGRLRITGGKLVRRYFQVPEAADRGLVRPASDRVREAVFSSLFRLVEDATVLDLFAGSGAYGFEAVSRGAKQVTFVEKDPSTARCIGDNIVGLGVQESCKVVVADALRFVADVTHQRYDLIFADPPYVVQVDPAFWQHVLGILQPVGTVIYRCAKKQPLELPAGFEVRRQRAYGGTEVYFLQPST